MIYAIVLLAATVGALAWVYYWSRVADGWNLAMRNAALTRKAQVQSTIASDPMQVFRAVLQVVGVVVAGLVASL